MGVAHDISAEGGQRGALILMTMLCRLGQHRVSISATIRLHEGGNVFCVTCQSQTSFAKNRGPLSHALPTSASTTEGRGCATGVWIPKTAADYHLSTISQDLECAGFVSGAPDVSPSTIDSPNQRIQSGSRMTTCRSLDDSWCMTQPSVKIRNTHARRIPRPKIVAMDLSNPWGKTISIPLCIGESEIHNTMQRRTTAHWACGRTVCPFSKPFVQMSVRCPMTTQTRAVQVFILNNTPPPKTKIRVSLPNRNVNKL